MLLLHYFDDPQLNLSLEVFLREARECLGDQMLSVVLYGSIVFDDLAPGYGDLDFMAVLRDPPTEERRQRIIELRKPLRNGEYGIYCHMLEGPFLPLSMFDPATTSHTICWGTGGERHWEHNKLGWFCHRCIRDHGIVIYGDDLRSLLPAPTREQLLLETRDAVQYIRTRCSDGGLHSIDRLLLAARLLLWLREDRLDSKSGAADWAYEHAVGKWKEHLPMARDLRKNTLLIKQADTIKWLSVISGPAMEACDEIERELERQTTNAVEQGGTVCGY